MEHWPILLYYISLKQLSNTPVGEISVSPPSSDESVLGSSTKKRKTTLD